MIDQQLQLALVKMLPETIRADYGTEGDNLHFEWLIEPRLMQVRDTERLHVCWLVEQDLSNIEGLYYNDLLNTFLATYNYFKQYKSTWQQRAEALCKVKGIEIV